jgi:hypothetical protein
LKKPEKESLLLASTNELRLASDGAGICSAE